ncbi:hypothetical protein [Prosthecobacter sp.]|uniref:hypothetical protein n=1 Tax=Prosthecobacter sp. TaxID=1965333 RepID=UPI003784D6F9
MAFIFSTSHLPETRVRRPDQLEEEEDEDVMQQPPPRVGGVRAFSHLPQPVRAQADSSGPLSTRPATPVGSPRPYVDPEADFGTDGDRDTDHAPGPDSDHEDNDAPRAHDAYAHDTPWHQPRITAQDRPPQVRDEDETGSQLNRPVRDSSFDDAHSAERSTSTTRDNSFSPSPQKLRDDFHSPTREATAQDSTLALPRGRIFEKRQPPGYRGQGTGLFQNPADKADYHDLVYHPRSSPEDEENQRSGFFQNVADTRDTRQAPSSAKAPQTISQSSKTGEQAPTSKPAQSTVPQRPPPAGQPRDLPLTTEDLEELYTKEGEERKPRR